MKINTLEWFGTFAAAALLVGCGPARAGENDAGSLKSAASSIVTNENGSVSRTFTESSVTTNGNLVTEHRRETRTEMDVNGNVLQTSTSEYAQSYNVGDVAMRSPSAQASAAKKGDGAKAASTDSFMGLKFGEVQDVKGLELDPDDATLLRAPFKPKKPLAGFDDYFVYVTPKTHKLVKVCACAKEAVEPGARWRRHYLIEALEKRYHAWARLCSFRLPYYAFDVAPDRYVTVCLAGASADYQTVISAWDNAVARQAAEEYEQAREEARRKAVEARRTKVEEAESIF